MKKVIYTVIFVIIISFCGCTDSNSNTADYYERHDPKKLAQEEAVVIFECIKIKI